jgi:hypothetical protein
MLRMGRFVADVTPENQALSFTLPPARSILGAMIRPREVKLIAALGLAVTPLLAATPTAAGPGPTRHAPRRAARAASSTPPDVRRGEAYDGRAPERVAGHGWQAVPRTLLFLPRVAVTLVSRTTVAALDWLQRSGVGPFLHRVCFAFGGRMVTLPTVAWERGLTPKAGASFTTNLLLGKTRRAGLHAEAAAGHRDTWHAALKVFPLGLPGLTQHERLGLSLATRYDRRHDRPFFGRGYRRAPPGLDSNALCARFDGEVFTADATGRIRLWRTLALELGVGADWRRQRDSDLPQPTAATLDLVDALGAELASREDVSFTALVALGVGGPMGRPVPAPGFRARLWARARVGGNDTGHHLALGGALEGFSGLWGSHRRLGLRALVRAVARLDEHDVPLLHLPCLGGPSSMRGFVSGRLCGESIATLTAAYHQALHPRLWLSLFIDWGGAFREGFIDATWSAVDVAGGAALALRITRLSWMRLQVAGSRDGVAVFLGWGGAP